MATEQVYAPWVDFDDPDNARLETREPNALSEVSWKLAEGVSVGDEFPEDVVFRLSSTSGGVFLPDSLPNAYNYYIVSERLKGLLEGSSGHFEFHRVRIQNHKGRIEKAPYYVANLLDVVDCMDKKKSEFVPMATDPTQAIEISRLVLDHKRIPKDAQIFRLRSELRLFVVRKDLGVEIYRKHKCTGVLFEKIELYGDAFREVPDEPEED